MATAPVTVNRRNFLKVSAAAGGGLMIALYSDGSWFMMRIVDRGFFVNYDHARSYALGLWQVPLVFALRAGVTDLQWLAKAYSFGTLLLPAALYQLALLRSRDDAALMVGVIAAIAAVFSTSFMFSVGEYSTAYATAVAVMAFCARRDTARLTDGIVMLVLGVLSVRTYEIFYHLGPLLAALLVWPVLGHAQAAIFQGADLKLGAQLIAEHQCVACHTRRVGGDGVVLCPGWADRAARRPFGEPARPPSDDRGRCRGCGRGGFWKVGKCVS